MQIFEQLESQVRSYSRSFPAKFDKAQGPFLYDSQGVRYLDFFCGAGALCYGHNEPRLKREVMRYLEEDRVIHSLDMATVAKAAFLEAFQSTILGPRGWNYKMQFVGPTGTNAVEAACKLARRVKRRANIVAFTNSFHGLTAGALALTADSYFRHESYINRANVSFLPYDGYFGPAVDTFDYIEKMLTDPASGIDLPAAVIVEAVQAEGGVNVARERWLQQLAAICAAREILLIVDDIQVGCGRCGSFFSFERAGIRPDIVLLSKAISGFGLPLSLVLLRPEWDQWNPGEHSGTFRGNNLAFVTATAALEFWKDGSFAEQVRHNSRILAGGLDAIRQRHPAIKLTARGIGMICGLEFPSRSDAQHVARKAFESGLIIELCGPRSNVLKFLPPLNIDPELLQAGLDVVERCIETLVVAGTTSDTDRNGSRQISQPGFLE